MRSKIIATVAIIAILCSAALYLFLKPSTVNAPTDTVTDASAQPVGHYEEHESYYDIDATFPTVTPLRESAGAKADETAVATMRSYIINTVEQFKKDGNFANLTPEDTKTLGLDTTEVKYDLQINYYSAVSPHTVSYIFESYSYTLGAHGNTFYRTFTFDINTGKELLLVDLFAANAAYLDTLSVTSRDMLLKNIDENLYNADFAIDGTTPINKSFANFFLDPTSLVIIFPPYAVAPYAAGTQTLAIPRTELQSVLKLKYQ